MMKISHLCIALLAALLLSAGCELYPQDGFEEDYVLEAYLVANRPLPRVRLSTSVPVDREYSFGPNVVNGAAMAIHLLEPNGDVALEIPYRQQLPGVYQAQFEHRVLPGRRYRLVADIEDEPVRLTSTTLVPGEMQIVNQVVDTIAYQDPAQVEITTTRSEYPGRQAYFIFSVRAQQVDSTNLTPFYADQFGDEDTDLESYRITSSGIINEKNYEEHPDGTLTLRVPWLAVAFYGDNQVITSAIDDNMYDFLRTQAIQGGNSTLPPGEFQNISYNVEGGIGIFGSLASDTVAVHITPIPETGL